MRTGSAASTELSYFRRFIFSVLLLKMFLYFIECQMQTDQIEEVFGYLVMCTLNFLNVISLKLSVNKVIISLCSLIIQNE